MSAHPTWVSRFGQAPTIALSMPAWNALGTAGYANVGITGRKTSQELKCQAATED